VAEVRVKDDLRKFEREKIKGEVRSQASHFSLSLLPFFKALSLHSTS
jgi:hypothetical protein